MPVTADSYESKAIAIAADMLAASASFCAAVGALTATEAKSFIVETHSGAEIDGETGIGKAMDGSDIDLTLPPYAIIGLEPGVEVDAGVVGYPDYTIGILVRLVMVRSASGQTPAENTRAAWNLTGAVRAEMQAQVGGGTAFADAEVSSAGLAMDQDGVHRDHTIAELIITARG